MNTQRNIEKEVIKILTDISGTEKITHEQTLATDIGLNSLRAVEVVIAIEDTFGILLKQSDMNLYKLKTVGDLIALVETYLGNR